MKGDQIAVVIDWEFAGSYSLSETLSDGGINVVEADSEELDDENTVWDRKIGRFIYELAMEKKWEQEDIDVNGRWESGVGKGKKRDVSLKYELDRSVTITSSVTTNRQNRLNVYRNSNTR